MTAPRRATPSAGAIEVWVLPGAAADAALAAIALSEPEAAAAARMATEGLRARARRRRRFLRAVLARYLGGAPERVALAVEPGGKPVLAEDGPHFNLSHTGDVSVLAVGADPLGIDVERRKTFGHFAGLVARTCSPRERASILADADPAAAFLDRWVLKEAVLKARGTGLVDDLPGVDPGPVGAVAVRWADLAIAALAVPPRLAGDGPLHAALAVAGPLAAVTWMAL